METPAVWKRLLCRSICFMESLPCGMFSLQKRLLYANPCRVEALALWRHLPCGGTSRVAAPG